MLFRSAYVAAAHFAVESPHSDYAERMVRVCRARPKAFAIAVDHFATEDRDWFTRHVFDPVHCRALKLAEAD